MRRADAYPLVFGPGRGDGDNREDCCRGRLAEAICEAANAQPVQHIGKILVIYRPKPAEEQKVAKPRAKRKLPRKTKRSFQKS